MQFGNAAYILSTIEIKSYESYRKTLINTVATKTREDITMTKDLTKGNPMKLIISFAVPLLFGFLFQQFYNLVDTMIVGRFLGVDDLAAVGSTGSINFLVIGFCMGVCNGFAIPVSHKFGAGDYVGMRKYVANCAWLGLVFSVVMTVVTAILCRNILVWMKTPANIIDGAYDYIFIIFIGIPTVYLYNIVAGVIRATGDSKTPVVFLVLSSIINIVLDLYFIISLHMGVAGAAWATVISQGVSGVACLVYMVKKFEILRIRREEWKVDGHMMMVLCGMGVPMGLQYSITAIGSVILQTAANTLGSAAVAAMTAGGRIGSFLACPFDAMGSTMATYGGQNVGAGKLDRLSDRRIFRRSAGAAVRGRRRGRDHCQRACFSVMEYGILYSACTGEYCPLPDPGYGFPEIRHFSGCLRNDSKIISRLWTGAHHRLHRGMPGQPHCMADGRCLPYSGLFPCE